MSKIDELRLGFETAYINGSAASNSLYRPQFVSNNHKEGKKVLSSVEDELLKCDRFQISVAFITMSGITPVPPDRSDCLSFLPGSGSAHDVVLHSPVCVCRIHLCNV